MITEEAIAVCIERLRYAKDNLDQEEGHMAADDALCDLLMHFGCREVVDLYREIPKWFA